MENDIDIHPRCEKGENVFISNEGYLLPCCYAHIFLLNTLGKENELGKNDLWFARNLDLFDLKKRDIKAILADDRWNELRQSWKRNCAPSVCYRQCGVPRGLGYETARDVRKRDRDFVKLSGSDGE